MGGIQLSSHSSMSSTIKLPQFLSSVSKQFSLNIYVHDSYNHGEHDATQFSDKVRTTTIVFHF